MAGPLLRLAASVARYRSSSFLVHRPGPDLAGLSALRPGVRAGSVEGLLDLVRARR